jgi:hypothetical protein
VTSHRCLDRNRCCLGVADLADQDDIRIAAQDRAEAPWKSEAALDVDFDLS